MTIFFPYIGLNVCPVCMGDNDYHFPRRVDGKRMCAGPYFDDSPPPAKSCDIGKRF